MTLPQLPIAILLARLNGTPVGFAASAVRVIIRAVAITPLLGAPSVIEGAINLRGRIIPVVDVRQRLGMMATALSPDQYIIALEARARVIAIRVDAVDDVVDVDLGALETQDVLSPILRGLEGVAATESGALVVYDVDAFLTQAEHEVLDQVVPA